MATCLLHRNAMESMMSLLKELTFAAVPRDNTLSPQQKRRNKLIARTCGSNSVAEAEIDGRIHVVERRWERTQDGREASCRGQQAPQAVVGSGNGTAKLLLTVRYGAKRPLSSKRARTPCCLLT